MMDTLPRISVVMPLYNKSAYVLRAIESVLTQGEAILEVLVVDDGSTDDGPDRVAAFAQPKVRLIRKPNGGVSSARNRGIEEARGEYVAFLDADDVYLPGFADEILALTQAFPEVGVYATSYLRVWPDGKRIPNYIPRSLQGVQRQIVPNPFRAWSRSSFIHIGSICIRRSTLLERNIRFPIGENVGEDQDVIFRLFETGEIAFSSMPLMAYTQEVANSLYSNKPAYILPCYTRLLERARKHDYPEQLRIGACRIVAVSHLNVARILIGQGRRTEAFKHLTAARLIPHPTYWLRTLIRLCLPVSLFKVRWFRWI